MNNDLISRSALKEHIGSYAGMFTDELGFAVSMEAVLRGIDFAESVDAVEVVHGEWIGLEYDGYADGCPVYDLWECSECGEEVSGEDVPTTHPYCHGCGAKMDGERKGDDAKSID